MHAQSSRPDIGRDTRGDLPSLRLTVDYTVATLPSASAWLNRIVVVVDTDGAACDQTGSVRLLCVSNGISWEPLSAGGGGPANTDELSEGPSNLYFTQTRARQSLTSGTNVSYDTETGAINVPSFPWGSLSSVPSTFPPNLSGVDSDDIGEGTTNRYFSNALARAAVSAGTNVAYDSGTGVISVPSAGLLPAIGGELTNARLIYTSSGSLTSTANINTNGNNLTGANGAARVTFNTAGSAAAPTFSFNNDIDTGLWPSGADEIGFSTGGTNRVTLSTSLLSAAVPVSASAFQVSGSPLALSHLGGDTDDVDEGATNLYFSDGRARTALEPDIVVNLDGSVSIGGTGANAIVGAAGNGGTTITGGPDAGDDLILRTASHAAKGDYVLPDLTGDGCVEVTSGVLGVTSCGSGGGGGAGAPVRETFTSETEVTVSHNFGTLAYVVQCFDENDSPIGFATITSRTTTEVTVDFNGATLSGDCVAASGATAVSGVRETFTAETGVEITHNFGTLAYAVHCIDDSNNAIYPAGYSDWTTSAVTVDLGAEPISGACTAVAGGSGGGFSGDYGDLTNVPSTFAPAAHALAGSDHTASGLTTGHVLRATGATTFAFGALEESDLPSAAVTLTGVQTLTNKTLTTPTIGSFANAAHNHQDSAGGGALAAAAIASGTLAAARIDQTANYTWTGQHTFSGDSELIEGTVAEGSSAGRHGFGVRSATNRLATFESGGSMVDYLAAQDTVRTFGPVGFSSIPACSTTPFWQPINDSLYGSAYCDGGSTLTYYVAGRPMTRVTSGSFSWTNQDTASVATVAGMEVISSPANSGTEIYVRHLAAPSTPWTATMCYTLASGAVSSGAGIALGDSTPTAWRTFGTNAAFQTTLTAWTNATTVSANVRAPTAVSVGGSQIKCQRVTDDGADRIYQSSADRGVTWATYYTEGRTEGITAATVGFYLQVIDATYGATASILHWSVQ